MRGEDEVVFDRYEMAVYYGPPYRNDEIKRSETYNYMVTSPYPLSKEQITAILHVIMEFNRNERPCLDRVTLVDGRITQNE